MSGEVEDGGNADTSSLKVMKINFMKNNWKKFREPYGIFFSFEIQKDNDDYFIFKANLDGNYQFFKLDQLNGLLKFIHYLFYSDYVDYY